MIQEEKYKHILQHVIEIISNTEKTDIGFATICSYIGKSCPELKESEDERIRKWLIDWARAVNWSEQFTITKEQVIAWLEKQGEPEDKGEISDGYHTFNELYRYRLLYNAAFFNLLPKELVHKSKKHHDGEECFGGGWFIVMANLPTGQISNHYELKDWDLFKIPEREVADEWDGHTPQEAADRLHKYLLEKQGKQTQLDYEYADIPQKDFAPIEPKFKVGDWVVQENIGIYKVIEVCESWYEVVDNKDEHYSISFNKEYMCHLWSINDAKNGDVLVAKGGYFKEYVFKFSSFTEDNVISTHFGYDVFHGNFDTKLSRFGREEDFEFVNPATKEQRDLLFSKMKEAGYEWDADKKELKKIEPKTLDADKVIEWMCHNTEYFWNSPYTPNGFINQFKKDFGL